MLLKDFLEVCCDDFVIYNASNDNEFVCSSVFHELPEDCCCLLDCYIKYVSSTFHIFDEKRGYIHCVGIYLIV